MRRSNVRMVAVVAAVVGLAVTTWPAEAHTDEPLIQPGAAAYPGHTPLGPWSPCTLNFVFRDARDTFIGTAARCTVAVGERVSMADREFGTVVFRAFTGTDALAESATNPEFIDDFALIRVDRDEVHRVSPVVLGFHRAPNGYTTSEATPDGDLVLMTGQGVGVSGPATRMRPGVLLSDDPKGFRADLAIVPGDAGAPVMYQELALGVVSAHGVPGAFGTSVERILALLHGNGFRVQLVTAWDGRVTEPGEGCQQAGCFVPT